MVDLAKNVFFESSESSVEDDAEKENVAVLNIENDGFNEEL